MLRRARKWNLSRPPSGGPVKQAFDDVVGLAAVAVRVIGIAVVLARLSWWIVPAVLAVAVPFVLLGIRGGQRAYELERRVARQRRRATYLSEEVLQGRDPAAERALFGYSDYVKRRWRTVFEAVVRLEMLPGDARIWCCRRSRVALAAGGDYAGIIIARPSRPVDVRLLAWLPSWRCCRQSGWSRKSLVHGKHDRRLAQHREFFVDLTACLRAWRSRTERSLTR